MRDENMKKMDALMKQSRMIVQKLNQELELSQGEMITLNTIHELYEESDDQSWPSLSELAARVGISRPAISKVIRNLAMKGFVEHVQSSVDRRVTHIRITVEGGELLQKENDEREKIMQTAFQLMGEEKTQQLFALMGELFDHMEQEVIKKNETNY